MIRSTVGSNIFGRRGKRACDAAELEHEKRQRHPQCWHGTQTGRSTLKWVYKKKGSFANRNHIMSGH